MIAPSARWLPVGFEFLSGLPEPERRRRQIMVVQVFADESGGKGHADHFVMVGLISASAAWAEFSNEWRACLRQPPAVHVFKMRDAAGLTGAFRGWNHNDRDQKLRQLARIINRYVAIYTYSAINLTAYAKIWEHLGWSPQNDPYFHPFHNTIFASCFELWDRGLRERFSIVFDENVIFGPRARIWYPLMREVMQIREPEVFPIMPGDLLFGTDDDFLPIQACDLFAWCIRRSFDVGGDPGFNWLLDEFRDIQGTDYSQYYDEERMKAVSKDAWEQSRDGLARYPNLITIYDEIRDQIYGKKR
jgi:hypothetical protein